MFFLLFPFFIVIYLCPDRKPRKKEKKQRIDTGEILVFFPDNLIKKKSYYFHKMNTHMAFLSQNVLKVA